MSFVIISISINTNPPIGGTLAASLSALEGFTFARADGSKASVLDPGSGRPLADQLASDTSWGMSLLASNHLFVLNLPKC